MYTSICTAIGAIVDNDLIDILLDDYYLSLAEVQVMGVNILILLFKK
jgi:hypothetical protein